MESFSALNLTPLAMIMLGAFFAIVSPKAIVKALGVLLLLSTAPAYMYNAHPGWYTWFADWAAQDPITAVLLDKTVYLPAFGLIALCLYDRLRRKRRPLCEGL
jgi:hypothetical protein